MTLAQIFLAKRHFLQMIQHYLNLFVIQLIRYARASTLYDDFLSRSCRLTSKLLRQGYERFKLISAFKKFYGRHKILVDRYKVSVTHIISDLFLETLYRS